MNRQTMLHNRTLVIAGLLALTACNQTPPAEPPLAGAAIGGDFTLTGEDGKQVSWEDFDGKYRTVYFGYTYCPDVCPVDTQRAMAGLKAFEKENPALGAKIQPLFISIDPERDTPQALTEFTDNFHPRLIGMTGTKEQLDKVTDQFAATYSIGESRKAAAIWSAIPTSPICSAPTANP